MVQGGPALLTSAAAPTDAIIAIAGTRPVSEMAASSQPLSLARAGRLLDAGHAARQWGHWNGP